MSTAARLPIWDCRPINSRMLNSPSDLDPHNSITAGCMARELICMYMHHDCFWIRSQTQINKIYPAPINSRTTNKYHRGNMDQKSNPKCICRVRWHLWVASSAQQQAAYIKQWYWICIALPLSGCALSKRDEAAPEMDSFYVHVGASGLVTLRRGPPAYPPVIAAPEDTQSTLWRSRSQQPVMECRAKYGLYVGRKWLVVLSVRLWVWLCDSLYIWSTVVVGPWCDDERMKTEN